VLYDITNSLSFSQVPRWLAELDKYGEHDVVKMLIGNKADLEESRSVTLAEAQKYAEKEHLLFLEASAKTAANVNEAFMKLVTDIIGSRSKAVIAPNTVTVVPAGGVIVEEKKGCC
jgi:GTPase SAR1 family protein